MNAHTFTSHLNMLIRGGQSTQLYYYLGKSTDTPC